MHIFIHIHAYMHTHTCTYAYMHICILVELRWVSDVYAYIITYLYICEVDNALYIYTHTEIHTCIYTYFQSQSGCLEVEGVDDALEFDGAITALTYIHTCAHTYILTEP
jgi:hypothetical protein